MSNSENKNPLPQGFSRAYQQYTEDVTGIKRSQAYNYSTDTSDITCRTDRNQYKNPSYRYNEVQQEKIVFSCMQAYEDEPIVRNIIDLMSDFGSQGVRIICADKSQEKFGQEWFEYAQGPERCERFLNILYRGGTVVVKYITGKVPTKTRKKWKTTTAGTETIEIKDIDTGKAVIPLKWVFYDPRQVVMVGGMVANFVGKPIFALRINEQLRQEIYQLNRLTENQKELEQFKKLIPDYIWKALREKAQFFPLDQDKIAAYYYKKDDWELWGKPLVRPILKHLNLLNKIEKTDSAALDGAMSAVRLWQLGSIKDGIVPGKAAIDKLRSILANIVPGGVTDIVWGDDLKYQESQSNLHQWLDPKKYQATLASIYAGLGVPPGLTGSSGSGSFTNNNISLKTLIERLKYGRTILLQFLHAQLELVQKAMGFTHKFEIAFDQMVLSDEAAEKNLLIGLYDRNLISGEAVRYAFDIDHSDIEETKVKREFRKQGKALPEKASPFHNPEKKHELEKIDKQNDFKKEIEKMKPKGTPLSGRPKNSGDKKKRKARRVLPRGTSAEYKDLFKFAESAQQKIEEIINPAFISMCGKKNVRSLTSEETDRLEGLKFRIFSNIDAYSDINDNTIAAIAKENLDVDNDFYITYAQNVYTVVEKYGRGLTVQEKRNIMCESFAEIFSEN